MEEGREKRRGREIGREGKRESGKKAERQGGWKGN